MEEDKNKKKDFSGKVDVQPLWCKCMPWHVETDKREAA